MLPCVEYLNMCVIILLSYYNTSQEFNNNIKCEEITNCWTDRNNVIDYGRMLRKIKD